MTDSAQNGPFHGIRVLDMTAVLMGPFCTQILGDLGAEIIKLEAPEGDITRQIGPGRRPGASGLYQTLNRGKRSVVLNLKQPEAKAALLEIARSCDLFIHSTRPAAMQRLGLSYDELRAVNPSIVYVNLGGFGRNGRYAGQPAYDDVIQGLTGVPLLEAHASGNEPRYLANVMADKVSGLTAAYACMAALYARKSTGQGQEVDVSMFETMASFMLTEHMTGAIYDPPESEPIYQRLVARERRPFRTADGYIAATIYTNPQVARFAKLSGRSELTEDPRFCDVSARLRHVADYCNLLQEILQERDTDSWLTLLNAAEIPAARINSTEDLLHDPHLAEVGFFSKVEHPLDGTLTFPGPACVFSRTPAQIRSGPPELGEHTQEVLREFGLDDTLVARLTMPNSLDADAHSSGPEAKQ